MLGMMLPCAFNEIVGYLRHRELLARFSRGSEGVLVMLQSKGGPTREGPRPKSPEMVHKWGAVTGEVEGGGL